MLLVSRRDYQRASISLLSKPEYVIQGICRGSPTTGINFQIRGGAEYPDLGFPKKVNARRKTAFYMRKPAPENEIGIPPFSVSPSHPRNLQEFPRAEDMHTVKAMQV